MSSVIEVSHLKEMSVQNVFGHSPLYGLDDVYTFFHDESNNSRKLYLTDVGFNDTPKNFILGGVCVKGKRELPKTDLLLRKLKIQPMAKEISFSEVAFGTYPKLLSALNLRTVISWMLDNDVYLHYNCLNMLYWSIVDVVDSILIAIKQGFEKTQAYKNQLYKLAKQDVSGLAALLKKHNYPSISKGGCHVFMIELSEYLIKVARLEPTNDYSLILSLVEKGATLSDLVFIQENEPDELISSFDLIYTHQVYMYPNSTHNFDEEKEIQKRLNGKVFTYHGRKIEYQFLDSEKSLGIQLADVICGLMRSHFDFLDKSSEVEIVEAASSLNKRQKDTLVELNKLITKSDQQSNSFLHWIAPDQLRHKDLLFYAHSLG